MYSGGLDFMTDRLLVVLRSRGSLRLLMTCLHRRNLNEVKQMIPSALCEGALGKNVCGLLGRFDKAHFYMNHDHVVKLVQRQNQDQFDEFS